LNGDGNLLSLRLTVDYPSKPAVLRDVALELRRGEILGLVGQSGSGKSTLALAVLRLLGLRGGVAHGSIRFEGHDLLALSERGMRELRGRSIALVLQSPLSALNPALRIGTQLKEAWRAHSGSSREACHRAIVEALACVSLDEGEAFLRRFPSEMSVGQAQRVLIAMAILHRPSLLIADEPTSALDAITQAEVLALLGSLNRKLGTAVLYISHDLLSVAALCHRIAILEAGEIVETACSERIFTLPAHPYTQRLISALPVNPFFRRDAELVAAQGESK
jgi:ABC-type dipeptide/oligopeptide/nickel transport system ATPase component